MSSGGINLEQTGHFIPAKYMKIVPKIFTKLYNSTLAQIESIQVTN